MNQSTAAASTGGASPTVFKELGAITRQLHEALNQLGYMPKLQQSAQGLPDARSRLSYIAVKTGEAAERVLNSVEQAKGDQLAVAAAIRALSERAMAHDDTGEVAELAERAEAGAARIDAHLTDIMMAQDFHDLTGQVVAKVVTLAMELEDSLVKLLVKAAPAELAAESQIAPLNGPVVNPEGRTDVVSNQSEVDDLLASLGF